MQVVIFPEIRLYRQNVGRGYNYKTRGSFGRQGGFIKEIAVLYARMNPEAIEAIKAQAEAASMTVGEYIEALVLK